MNIQAEKIELVKMILETDNPSILNSIKKMLKRESKKDFWDTLPQSQKEDIMKGIEEIENGEIVDYEDFIKKHK
jgi:predicted Zn-ribbon and HTH transcriptional regulator